MASATRLASTAKQADSLPFGSAANVEIKTLHQFRPRTEMLQSGNARN
jgi:hypothetical protein